MTRIEDLLEEYRSVARSAAEGAALVERLDEERKIVFSQQVLAAGDIATTKAEHIARASDAYRTVCKDLAAAREQAGKSKAEAEYIEKRIMVWHSRAASARASQQHGGQR